MFKKLLLVSCLAAAGLNAQTSYPVEQGTAKLVNKKSSFITAAPNQKAENINGIQDTLYYTLNKQNYKNTAANNLFSLYSSPYPSTTLKLTHAGAIFQNTGTVTINGLEAMMSKRSSSANGTITVHVLLYNVVNGVPVMPALDSISGLLSLGTYSNEFIGDDFADGGKQVTGDYAVMYRCASVGDTIMAWSNNACTYTSTAAPQARRFGEGFGAIRVNGVFRTTTDYLSGTENDKEFIVAPRVQFNSVSSVTNPTTTPCVGVDYTYTSSASFHMTHRQYNLNVFYRTWKPFANPNAAAEIPADSVFVWSFGDATGNKYPVAGAPTISHSYSTAAIGVRTGTFSVNYMTQVNYANRKIADRTAFTSTVQTCLFDGLKEQNGFANVSIYPNPAVNGKTNISGLTGTNTITVYNLMGQLVTTVSTDKDLVTIDLLNHPAGNYIMKISNTENNTMKVTKIINPN